MKKAKDIALFVLLCALSAVCVFACLRLHQFGRDEAQLVDDGHQAAVTAKIDADEVSHQAVTSMQSLDVPVAKASSLLGNASSFVRHLDPTVAKLNTALDEINRDCDEARTQKPCGTLADFAKMLKTFRGAAGQLEIAAVHENRNLSTLDGQEAQIFADTHGDLVQLAQTLKDADGVFTDPATKQTQQNLAAITGNLAGITKDGRIEADKFVAPQPWWKKALAGGETGIKIAMCVTGKVTCTL